MRFARTSCLAGICALAACSSGVDSSQRALSGRIDVTQVRLLGGPAIATARNGRVFRAPISATGDFRLMLPVGAQYTIRFANATTSAKTFDSFAVLAVRASRHAFNWTAGTDVSLGRVGHGVATTLLQPAHEGSGGGGSSDEGGDSAGGGDEGDGDGKCVEDDQSQACDLSQGMDEVEVDSEHDLLADVDSDGDGQCDAQDNQDDRPTCGSSDSAMGGDDCKEGDDDGEHEMDHEHSMKCSSGGGDATDGGMSIGGAPNPAPVPGLNVP